MYGSLPGSKRERERESVYKTPEGRKKGGVLYRLYDPRREEKRRGKIVWMDGVYNNIHHTPSPPR